MTHWERKRLHHSMLNILLRVSITEVAARWAAADNMCQQRMSFDTATGHLVRRLFTPSEAFVD